MFFSGRVLSLGLHGGCMSIFRETTCSVSWWPRLFRVAPGFTWFVGFLLQWSRNKNISLWTRGYWASAPQWVYLQCNILPTGSIVFHLITQFIIYEWASRIYSAIIFVSSRKLKTTLWIVLHWMVGLLGVAKYWLWRQILWVCLWTSTTMIVAFCRSF